MRGGRFLNSLRQLARQPVSNTPLIRNAFELGHCVSKPIKQGCMSPPSKEKQYFLIGLSSSMKQQHAAAMKNLLTSTHIKNSSSAAAMVQEPLEDKMEAPPPVEDNVVPPALETSSPAEQVCDAGISPGYWGVRFGKPNDVGSNIWNSFRYRRKQAQEPREFLRPVCEAGRDGSKISHRLALSGDAAQPFLKFHISLTSKAQRYICRAAMLETISGVPGMVGGMVLHCKSLRRVEHSGGWIKALMEEAENERMHLMTFMELSKPSWQERALVFTAQGMFMNAYFLLYVVSPRFAHRMAGYIREETIQSYTQLINDIDDGKVPNAPAPDLAIDYWRLPMDATLRDVVMVIRADEIHHREINHFAADVYMQGHTLKEAPADMVTMTTSFARSHASTT
ncbi:ubiquinol oxidase 1c, mitochondrial [Selaginella moellendorffii]|uniref:ubiquinol oxidase 1c, mitochondrial n=1 Tax=Selaginella moellendorffii TaxID=88036 RepID=UPI000D1CBD43|nr:ubiquinol oxidase 1c, mitochondrial [Selaginella moellendorffii]|eukprot:XP_024541293.1 ubiquinol oxidase 1c, mitochondrial [Selaginella moellendorffii]